MVCTLISPPVYRCCHFFADRLQSHLPRLLMRRLLSIVQKIISHRLYPLIYGFSISPIWYFKLPIKCGHFKFTFDIFVTHPPFIERLAAPLLSWPSPCLNTRTYYFKPIYSIDVVYRLNIYIRVKLEVVYHMRVPNELLQLLIVWHEWEYTERVCTFNNKQFFRAKTRNCKYYHSTSINDQMVRSRLVVCILDIDRGMFDRLHASMITLTDSSNGAWSIVIWTFTYSNLGVLLISVLGL